MYDILLNHPIRIEETWELWQMLMDDCKSFDDWLKDVEMEVRESAIDQLDVTPTKEEAKHFEVCKN